MARAAVGARRPESGRTRCAGSCSFVGGRRVKLKVVIGSLLWTLLITLAHVHVNVGWGHLRRLIDVARGGQRAELVVGFLPVT